jgi:hypothetical protein
MASPPRAISDYVAVLEGKYHNRSGNTRKIPANVGEDKICRIGLDQNIKYPGLKNYFLDLRNAWIII